MRFTLALLASLMASTAFADRIAVPAAQHGIFDGGRIPPAAQGVMTFGASDGLSLTARPYSALPLSGTSWHGLLLHGLRRDGSARLLQWKCMGGCLRDWNETSMSSQYLARAEGLEIKKDIRTVEIDMAVVKDRQATQQQMLEQILSQVRHGNSWRSMFIAGGSGAGGIILAIIMKIFHIGG